MSQPAHPPADDPASVLDRARTALSRGDGWTIDEAHYSRLRADCEALGVIGEVEMSSAFRRGIKEITVDCLHTREDPSYSGLEPGQTLYEAVWIATDKGWSPKALGKKLYLKFGFCGKQVEIFTFHESTQKGQK
jgi:hypothetical protein